MKVLILVLAVVLFACLPVGMVSAEVVLADFNSGEKPNNIGGDFGTWDKDPSDNTQFCSGAFDAVIKHGKDGYSFGLDYDVDSPNPAFNGFWMKLNDIDLSSYKNLSFWVKGDSAQGYTKEFKIELKTPDGVGSYYINGVTDKWRKFSIPLDAFNLPSLSNCQEFVIVFEDKTATDKEGIMYIDDIVVK
ncbi:MAG: carbohydrate binding domain-containing protein [Candidatus Auribacterota bacterium]|nr:carbohydrate binding domain-containing protein [Candidatus Auribacterota bacterium]